MPQENITAQDWYSEEQATFGDRLSGARQEMDFSQAELAARLGVRLKTLRGWEEDLSEPRANKLQMVAGVLNVSIMWLLTGEGDGLDAPDASGQTPTQASALLSELVEAQAGLEALARRIGSLERRLRAAITEESAQ